MTVIVRTVIVALIGIAVLELVRFNSRDKDIEECPENR